MPGVSELARHEEEYVYSGEKDYNVIVKIKVKANNVIEAERKTIKYLDNNTALDYTLVASEEVNK